MTLVELAREMNAAPGPYSKDHWCYGIYERYLAPLRERAITLLELGVYEGESTKIFSRYFPNASILAVDMIRREIDFSGCSNVEYLQCNQTDGDALAEIVDRYAPGGLDVVVDDASHVGWFSWISLCHLFPRLVAGGLYIVEDWGTGYKPGWVDGDAYQQFDVTARGEEIPRRLPSHDFGMVGFVKSLVDLAGSAEVGRPGVVPGFGVDPLEYLHVYRGAAILKKSTPE